MRCLSVDRAQPPIVKRAVTLGEFKAHCRTHVKGHDDTEEASLALLGDLRKPCSYGGKAL